MAATDNPQTKQPKKKKRSVISTVVLLISVGVFLFAAFQLISIFLEYHRGTKEYAEILDEAGPQDVLPDAENIMLSDLGSVDFTSLLAINPDTVAWIRFPNPEIINYPVVHSSDNTEYLTKTFGGNTNSSGAIFLDQNNNGDFSDENVIIYGHNMKNKSMFGSLKSYKDEAFCKENPYFYIYTIAGGIYRYKICAVYETKANSDAYQISFADEASYAAYLTQIQSRSLYETGTELTTASHLITLSTCTNTSEDGRLLVQGVLADTYQTENPAWPAYAWETN